MSKSKLWTMDRMIDTSLEESIKIDDDNIIFQDFFHLGN